MGSLSSEQIEAQRARAGHGLQHETPADTPLATCLGHQQTTEVGLDATVGERLGKARHHAVLDRDETDGARRREGSMGSLRVRGERFPAVLFAEVDDPVDVLGGEGENLNHRAMIAAGVRLFSSRDVCQTSDMAKIDHTFSIDKPPDIAQAMFVRDIAPDLARDGEFQIARERPGQLIFSDGAVPKADAESPLEGETQDEPWIPADAAGAPSDAFVRRATVTDDLPELFARHIHVDFSSDGTGTNVRVHGHVERDVCHGLERLGTPQHWPEIADRPHD